MYKLLAELALVPVKFSVKNMLGFDVLGENVPKQKVKFIKIPAMFMLGEKDEIVSFKDFKEMFDQYAGEHKKFRLLVDTSHSSERQEVDLELCETFLMKYKQKDNEEDVQEIRKSCLL